MLSAVIFAGVDKVDDFVHTGQTCNYTWYIVDRAAPGPSDGSSIVWMYHSHSHEIQDNYAGLMGAIIITRRVDFIAHFRTLTPALHDICSAD